MSVVMFRVRGCAQARGPRAALSCRGLAGGLPLRRVLVPPFSYRQLRRLAHDLGFPLDARPADLDAVQWAGLFAFLDSGPPWEDWWRSP
jgi:hypothetical protein